MNLFFKISGMSSSLIYFYSLLNDLSGCKRYKFPIFVHVDFRIIRFCMSVNNKTYMK